eukprot:scaffold721_cov131-Cylindrotheca_fusiformis.AAC.16
MEGWYYRLTLPEASFAFILSVEDPGTQSDLKLACIQVVGPEDTYLVQADKDDTKFWAFQHQQALGCTFEYCSSEEHVKKELRRRSALSPEEWRENVQSGFQVLPYHWLGRVNGHDGSKGGVLPGEGVPGTCEFDFTVRPICGWGSGEEAKQKSTGGWLASCNVFEPHWQVTLADARATGFVVWNKTRYDFEDQPFYAEKNWGAALPSKWYWTQCNSFHGYDQLSATSGGGVRKVPFGQSESLGMIGIHHDGKFYEAVPWANGFMDWNVSTWGYWNLTGRSTIGDTPFDVEVTYECDPERFPGLVFRAPTPDEGMVYFCRDTFEANVTLSLWHLEWDGTQFVRVYPPVIDQAQSNQGGAEIGGKISLLSLQNWRTMVESLGQEIATETCYPCIAANPIQDPVCERKSMGNVSQKDT